MAAVLGLTAEQVEQKEKRRLTPRRQRNVLWANLPSVMFPQERGHRFDEGAISRRRVVAGEQLFYFVRAGQQASQSLREDRLDLRDARGVAAAEHQDIVARGERIAEVVHQLQDAGFLGELGAEPRELHHLADGRSVCPPSIFGKAEGHSGPEAFPVVSKSRKVVAA